MSKAPVWFFLLTWTNSIAGGATTADVFVVRLAGATAVFGRSLKCCTVEEALDTAEDNVVEDRRTGFEASSPTEKNKKIKC